MNPSKQATPYLVALASIIVIIAGLKVAAPILVQLLMALFIAIICMPSIRWMEGHKVPRSLAIVVVLTVFLAFVYVIVALVGDSINAFNANKVVKNIQSHIQGIEITSWQQSQGALFSAVSMEKNMMWLMLSLIIAVAAFNIVSALVMVVIDKQGEIGILQTLGLSRADIVKVFLTQGMFNGIFGTTFGVILGLLATFYLNDVLSLLGLNLFGGGYAAQQLPVAFEISDLMTIIIGALSMTLLASLYPAYRASKTQPAEVLRNE